MSLILTIVLALAVTIPLAARVAPGESAAPIAFAAAAPLAAVLAVALTVVTAVLAGPLAAIPAVPTVLLAAIQLPRRRPDRRSATPAPPAAGRTVALRVLSHNVLAGRVRPDVIVAEVERLTPDILAIQELTPGLADGLAGGPLGGLLPYSYLEPGPGGRGIGVWSRWPLRAVTSVPGTARPMPRVTLDPGQPVTVTLVHPHAPVARWQKSWRADLARLLASLPEVTGHHLLIGDFNASRDLRPFRRLLAAGYADSSDIALHRPWPGLTFPANLRIPPLMRLDHILVSATGISVHQTRHLKVPRTDHLGVFAVMDLPPQPASTATRAGRADTARLASATDPAADAASATD